MSTEPNIDQIFSPLYFGLVIATASYGITCMQTFFYYVHYPNDRLYLKSFVAVLWTLNTVNEVLTIVGVYKFFIAGLRNLASIFYAPSELVPQLLLMALVAVPTQGYFVYRLYLFSGKYIFIPCIWVILAATEIVFSALYVGRALAGATPQGVSAAQISGSYYKNIGTVCLSVAAGVDVLIAMFLTFLLLRKRFATPIARTASILQRLIVFAVNTGIWPATFAVLSAILMHVYQVNFLYAVFGVPLCSIYCNTLLANLNARSYVRGEVIPQIDVDLFHDSSSASSRIEERQKGKQTVPPRQTIWKTLEMARSPEASQFATTGACELDEL